MYLPQRPCILHNSAVVLEPLTVADADCFYSLYTHPLLTAGFGEAAVLESETSEAFTERIISACDFIFTIRPAAKPQLIVGDCALHHWDRVMGEIQIGGGLFPQFWGQGYMQAAFTLLAQMAQTELGVKGVLACTQTNNHKAIRLAEKMGFQPIERSGVELTLRKAL